MLVPLLRLLTAGAAVLAPTTTALSSTVTFPNGATVTGLLETKPAGNPVQAFRGIPYAEPPVGERRWKPSTLKALTGNINATTYGSTCIGVSTSAKSTEDCLFLNIFAPASATKDSRLPVMVWIHGGALLNGESNWFDGHSIVNAGGKKVIVVNLNYRLGVFGFLSSRELLAEGNGANFGLRDQEVAFQWIKQYIQHFGGNPNDITAFGGSAGAWSLSAHMLSRNADQKLFHRLILQSGAYSTLHDTPPPSVQQDKANTIANAVGCGGAKDVLACLRSVNATAVTTVTSPTWRGFTWMPTVDGVFLYDTPARLLAEGKVSRIPTLIGTTTDEGWYFTSWVTQESQFGSFLRSQFSMLTEAEYAQIEALYPASDFLTLRHRTGEVYGDGMFTCPSEQFTEAVASFGTYRYRFNYPVNVNGYPLTVHGSDGLYLFNQVGDIPDTDEPAKAVAKHFGTFWTNFARFGSPNGASDGGQQQQQPKRWPLFKTATKQELVLQPTLAIDTMGSFRAGHVERCAFWKKVEQRIASEVSFAWA